MVDVRPEEEFLKGHIQGSVHIPDTDTSKLLEAVCADARTVLICADGRASSNIVRMMGVCGYSEVSHLQGGLKAWTEARLPLMETTVSGERPVRVQQDRESLGVVSKLLGTLSPQVLYAGLAGAGALLIGTLLFVVR